MDYNHSNTRKKIKINRIVLAIEILLVLGICGLISSIGISSLYSSANGTATEVDADYGVLINGYLTTFNTLSIMVEEKIQENPTFDEMNQWLQSMETTFQKAVGSEIYDGFALTYKGGYARSWSYGEYSDYDPSTRPWYQRAQSGDGKTEVVAPYVTYLDASYFEDDEYILMSIAKKYDEEISFDYDIKISEIKRLLMQRVYDYDDTHVILYDPEGYILSTNYEQEYAHNINQTDDVITSSMQKEILSDAEMSEGLNLHVIDGKLKIFYTSKDSRNNTFCIMYPFWEVFTQNFLGVILMGLVMIAAALYLYRNNKKGILEFERRDTQLSSILGAAFEQHMYVNLEDLSFYGSNRFGNMSEAPDYKSGYHQLLNQASDKDSQIKIKEFLSPKILRAQDEFDGKMTTARISLRAPGQKEIKTWEVFKMFSFIENKKMMTLLFDDVTEDAAILKKALKDAEDANHAKTEFLSRMSHDIRTPMNAIIGMTNLAKDEDCSPKVKEYLNNIDYSSKFLLGLINDILDLSKIESGELVLKPVPYTLAEFETSINTVIRPLFEAKNITFVFQMNARINCIMTDKLRFNQIFFNLLSNAAKFTPRGGKVEFVAEEISPKAGVYGARYYVRDNGIGMSEEFLPHVFEQFSQENSEKSNGVVGTGLGLPIVKSLVDAMGGTIEINSRLGAGTEYVIELYTPLVEPDTEEVNLENEEVSLENKKILLAEDNDMNILVARRLLEKEGCQITIAKNGKAAVEAFTTSPIGFYDAILMDVRMPEMTGIEATETIRGLNRRDSITIPIIAMTADAFAQEQKKTLDAGMNYHLSKPIEPQKLYKVLKHYISRKDKL